MSIITCPSGMQVRVRGMKVKEEKLLTDRKLLKTGEFVDRIVEACTEELIDAGPYQFSGDRIEWQKVLTGDIVFLLLRIREASYGNTYTFSLNCGSCKERFEWDVDTSELPVKSLPEGVDLRAPIAATLPGCGVQVTFHRGTNGDQEKIRKLRKASEEGNDAMAIGLCVRLDTIEGLDSKSMKAKRAFIDNLELADVVYLREKFDEYDCGVETEIEIECPECGTMMSLNLPFDTTFFLPKKRKTKPSESSPDSTKKDGESDASSSAGTSTVGAGS